MSNNRFHALAKVNIETEFKITDNLINMKVEPVYENGLVFAGEVYVSGYFNDNVVDEETLRIIVQDYLREYIEFAIVIKIEFFTTINQRVFSYQRTG
ncbi:MAG: hypothetical protein WC942_07075 [Clostridia bacterium]|jgi:hypothetical protein